MVSDRMQPYSFVALASFLRHDSRVLTLGVRPTLGDYTPEERRKLREAHCVLFPTMRFAEVLEAGGCRCFPSGPTYRYQRWRPLQWTLASFLGLPMVRARLCYGKKGKRDVLSNFKLPFRALGPRAGQDPIVLVKSHDAWEALASLWDPVLVLEHAPYRWQDEVWVVCGMVVAHRIGHWNGVDEPLWGPWVWVYQKNPQEEIFHLSRQVCCMAHIDEAVLCWGRTEEGRGCFFEGMHRPPPFVSMKGQRLGRHEIAFDALVQGMQNGAVTP
ncbi:MAG: hypothetical protein WHS46_07600 [Desulfosoma sp.]